jgi:DNA mismatch repair protein MutS2
MNNLSFETLEYNIVLGIISLYADSNAGRVSVTQLTPLPDSAKISHRLVLTEEAAKFISLYDILQKRNISGAVLEIEEVARIRTNLLMAEDVSFRLAETGLELEHMGKLIDNFPKLGSLIKTINRVLDDQGQIRDDASYELLEIRQSMVSLRNRVNKTLEDNPG